MEETNRLEAGLSIFRCVKCGECCRRIGHLSQVLPHQTNGVCHHLAGNLCSVYNYRPALCNYEQAYLLLKDRMTFREYHENVVLNCEKLRKSKMNRINNGEMAGSAPG